MKFFVGCRSRSDLSLLRKIGDSGNLRERVATLLNQVLKVVASKSRLGISVKAHLLIYSRINLLSRGARPRYIVSLVVRRVEDRISERCRFNTEIKLYC